MLLKNAKSLAPEMLGISFGLLAVGFALYLGYLFTLEPLIKLSDYIQILVLVVILSALIVSIWVQQKKERLDESNIYLINSIELINKAYSLLKKEDNTITSSRVSWVTSARLLKRAQTLALKISLSSHKIIYESEHDFQRHRFHDLLKIEEQPIPAEFFCGDGFVIGSIGKSAYSTLTKSEGANWIPPRVIAEIYRFSTFPKEYEDPLEESSKFSNIELERLWMFNDRGVCDYITFRNNYNFVSEKVFKIKGVNKASEVDAETIDQQMRSLSGIVYD